MCWDGEALVAIDLSFAQVSHLAVLVLGGVEQEILHRKTDLPQIFPTFATGCRHQMAFAED